MYRILVVDDDATCLTVAKACLKRCRYEVLTVTHALEALSILGGKGEEEKSYDVILADVHMPVMDGFELLQRVNKNFNIPVVLISADDKTEVICKGFRNGAPAYLIKPVTTEDVKHLWQFSVLWQNRQKNAYRRFNEASVPRSICSSSSSTETVDKPREKKTKNVVWTPNLHSRFVEVILILGPNDAVPKNILELMNVPSLAREQVASHLQKFRKLLDRVLNGKTSLEESAKYWIDYSYYSSIVGGNPNRILIEQLKEKRRSGKTAAPIPASLPLPPFNEAEASSSRSSNIAMLMANNYESSSVNVATPTAVVDRVTFQSAVNVATATPRLDGVILQSSVNAATTSPGLAGVTFQSAANLNMERIVGSSSTYNNPIQNQNYEANLMGYYNQPTVVPQQSYHITNGGLIGGVNNNMFPSTNPLLPSRCTTPILNNSISEQPSYVGSVGNNILFSGNKFNDDLQMGNIYSSFGANQFGIPLGMNEQLGSVQTDPNMGNSFGGANEFGNASAMPLNEQAPQPGAGVQMANGSWLMNNNNIPAADNSVLRFDPNLNQEEDWDDLLRKLRS